MDDFTITAPVAFFIFNRPDTTRRVFQAIRNAKPKKLLIIADGPRADHPDDAEKCAATRAIVEQIDWDCEVIKNYSEVNLGCKIRMSQGMDWVFNMVEEAIILEHDTLPHPTFFRYCQEMLNQYRQDEQIMMISGCNFQFGRPFPHSYYFSHYVHCWGWATWKRAWQHYDVKMTRWPAVRDHTWLTALLGNNPSGAQYWQRVFDLTYLGYVDTWDYQWVFACWLQNGFTILPSVNVVSNIGFGKDATHTGQVTSKAANIPLKAINFPLDHPPGLNLNAAADQFTQELYNTGQM